jgi:predicted HicB family RNase H-like nuclease
MVKEDVRGTTIRMPVELHRWLVIRAYDEETSIQDLILKLIRGYRTELDQAFGEGGQS